MDSKLLDLELLAASEYNSIKPFEEQQTISQNHLRSIAEIYVRARMHHSYGAGILHRHIALSNGYIMVHADYDNEVDVCKAENVIDLDCQNIIPHSFFLNSKGQFQAYEYDTGVRYARHLPELAFLCQLRSFLVENQLTSLVAILAEDARQDSVEFLLPNDQGMVCVPRREVYDGIHCLGPSVITGWKFCEGLDGKIECRERRSCEPQGDGQHKVKDTATRSANV